MVVKITTFVTCYPLFREFLDVKGLISVMLSCSSVLKLYECQESDSGGNSNTNEFLKRFSSLQRYMEDDSVTSKGTEGVQLVKSYVAFHESFKEAFVKVGRSISLRVDVIFEVAEHIGKYFQPEIFHYLLETSTEIIAPTLVAVVVQFACRDSVKQQGHYDDVADILEIEDPKETLELTLHEYRWGAHNPIGFRARDVEVISNFILSPRGTHFSRKNGERYWTHFECVSELNLYGKLDAMKKKSKTSSLMQCLTPSVILIGGQRRADIASLGP